MHFASVKKGDRKRNNNKGGLFMKKAEVGNKVKVHYTGKLDDGTVFDSSRERGPLEFTIGENKLIKGFEYAFPGMTPGDEKTIKIPAEEAYGAHRSELVVKVDRAQFPDNIVPQEGLQLRLKNSDGSMVNAMVTTVEEKSVTVDANHPLAGKDLNFNIELIEVL
jgi:peptidylprolyl isomerase